MDWIEDRWEKIKERVQNLSLKQALILYIALAAAAIILCFLVTTSILNGWSELLEKRYQSRNLMDSYNSFDSVSGTFHTVYHMPETFSSRLLEFLQGWSIFFYSITGIILAAVLFYNHRLKAPMELLRREAVHITRGDLDYECAYDSKDEMGQLCGIFNEMRLQLGENYRKTWSMMEQQRRLNAAFAHDLRTPLTVLRGYTDFLSRYYPEGKVSDEQLCDNLRIMSQQVLRLMDFSNTMKDIHALESLEVKKRECPSGELEQMIRDTVSIMNGTNGIETSYVSLVKENRVWHLDCQIVMEVIENAFSNCLRYAKKKIEVTLEETGDGRYLIVYIQDDGTGFSKEGLEMAANPYYRDKKEKEGNHFGLGLYICSLFCKKHGGELELSNSISGGAIISATFYVG